MRGGVFRRLRPTLDSIDVRTCVSQDADAGARTVCYCFGETEVTIAREFEQRGASHAVARVRAHIKAGRCACEIRNPLGVCCLGSLIDAVNQLDPLAPRAAAMTAKRPSAPTTMAIGQLASATGLTPDALRYYERAGLVAPPGRTTGGFRQYPASALGRVKFIQAARAHGLTIREVRELISVPGPARRHGMPQRPGTSYAGAWRISKPARSNCRNSARPCGTSCGSATPRSRPKVRRAVRPLTTFESGDLLGDRDGR